VPAGWLALALLAAAAGGGARPAAAQQRDFSKVEIKVIPVAGKVYMLEGAGGNIGVSVGEDGILLVDDQFEPLAPKIRAALGGIAGAGSGGGKIKLLINTHWHGDHVGGNKVFGPEATILAQTNVRRRLATEQTVRGEKVAPLPSQALPVVTYDQAVSVHWNGEEIKVVHFPHGHTDGDSVVFFTGSNVVHMGDDFFNGMFPFVDLGTGGSVQGLIDNVTRVLAMMPPDAKVIPGHGPGDARRPRAFPLDAGGDERYRAAPHAGRRQPREDAVRGAAGRVRAPGQGLHRHQDLDPDPPRQPGQGRRGRRGARPALNRRHPAAVTEPGGQPPGQRLWRRRPGALRLTGRSR
jgi:cyclase